MANKTRYFQIRDHVGVDPKGNLEPGVEIGLVVLAPKRIEARREDGSTYDVVVSEPERITVKPMAEGARIFSTDDPLIADAMSQLPEVLEEIDEPTKRRVAAAAKDTQDARDAAGTHTEPEEA